MKTPFVDPGFDSKDPRWIGAWWIGFVFLGIAIFLASVPIGLFPENINEASCSDEESNFERSLSDLFLSLKSLIRNPILFFHTLSIVFQINGLFGYFVYMPKYMESQYHKTASSASFFSGTVTMLAMVVGVFLSGFFIKKFKPRAEYLVGYIVFIEAVAGTILFSGLFMGCPSTSLEKDVYSANNPELPKCSQHCNCSYQAFNPICDNTGMVYFSPCTAGCYFHDEKQKNFYNCSCIASLGDHEAGEDATSGFCTGDCAMFLPYLNVVTIAKMLASTVRVGNVLVTLRCVDEKDKSLALGSVEFFISVFATIPYPLIYGYIISKTCVLWDTSCGSNGNCWLYDSAKFRNYLHSVSVSFIFLGFCCDLVVFFYEFSIK